VYDRPSSWLRNQSKEIQIMAAEKMHATDRAVMVAVQLAAALCKPGDTPQAAVDAFVSVLGELRRRGGVGRLLPNARGRQVSPSSNSR
jgi:hypothetical protein